MSANNSSAAVNDTAALNENMRPGSNKSSSSDVSTTSSCSGKCSSIESKDDKSETVKFVWVFDCFIAVFN